MEKSTVVLSFFFDCSMVLTIIVRTTNAAIKKLLLYNTRNFFRTQNPRLINDSGFKSRAGYNGTRMLNQEIIQNHKDSKKYLRGYFLQIHT